MTEEALVNDSRECNDGRIFVRLTHSPLDISEAAARVKSPQAGAIVMFAGTTRDTFQGKPVKELKYTSYVPKALATLLSIAQSVFAKHQLIGIAMIHRLGIVPIGEESILIFVSTPHRQAAFKAAGEALEECKDRAEIWKLEEFGGEEGGVWRANRDGHEGVRVDQKGHEMSD